MNSIASKDIVFKQICNQIPRNLVPQLARKHGGEDGTPLPPVGAIAVSG
jgi:hypothetical protein